MVRLSADRLVAAGYIEISVIGRHKSQYRLTHQSVIKTTFPLYFARRAGMTATCDATDAVLIIGRWKPFV